MTKPAISATPPSQRMEGGAAKAARAFDEGEVALHIRLPTAMHTALKVRAAEQRKTVRDLVVAILEEKGFG